ncbi:response regulator [Haliangium sp.]|uniref:response regulator n=1 Tax=Haliangium sp. TaxID=2663208 RepID=UPI003D0AED28
MSPNPDHPTILIIHDDSGRLDTLTRSLEAHGARVVIAATESAALHRLDADMPRAVIADWNAGAGMGVNAYRWAIENRYELRDRFVFSAATPPEEFDALVQGRCLLLPPDDGDELVRVALYLARRKRPGSAADIPVDVEAIDWGPEGSPTLLLVEDDPLQLDWMMCLLGSVGFTITSVESREAATVELSDSDYEVILSDWYMPDGSGAELHRWLREHRPHLVPRCVFMSASAPGRDDLAGLAPGCRVLPKGQDAPTLVGRLEDVVRQARARAA